MIEQSMIPQLLFDSLERAAFDVQRGDAPDNEGQWYTVSYTQTRHPRDLKLHLIADWSEILADYGTRIRVVEIGVPTADTVRIRVTKFVEQEKPRVRADQTSGDALRSIYEALRTLDSTVPEFESLSETKKKIFASQISTLRLTMKM